MSVWSKRTYRFVFRAALLLSTPGRPLVTTADALWIAPLSLPRTFSSTGGGNLFYSPKTTIFTTGRLPLTTLGFAGMRSGGGGGRGGNNTDRRTNTSGRGRGRRPRAPPPPMPPPGSPGRGCFGALVLPGKEVDVVQKQDQSSGRETRGTVARRLTNAPYHPRGIKVLLVDGTVGRVTRIVAECGGGTAGAASS